jgi:hypothetical protein
MTPSAARTPTIVESWQASKTKRGVIVVVVIAVAVSIGTEVDPQLTCVMLNILWTAYSGVTW